MTYSNLNDFICKLHNYRKDNVMSNNFGVLHTYESIDRIVDDVHMIFNSHYGVV